jgi:hypothetical protein
LTLPLIAPALILLPAMAFASPPDPSWIAGIYDGADGDDVVSLVYETSAANTAAPSHVGPLPCLAEISFDGIVCSVPDSRLTRRPRSPPILWSTEFASVFNSLPPPASRTGVPITTFPCPGLATSQDLARQRLISSPAKLKRPVEWMQDAPASTSRCEPHDIYLVIMEMPV